VTLVVALVGCTAPPSRPTAPTSTPTVVDVEPTGGGSDDCARRSRPAYANDSTFSGGNALGHVIDIVCDFGTDPPSVRDRAPGTPGRVAVAAHLGQVLGDAGWRTSTQGFSGRDYEGLRKEAVASYVEACSSEDIERVRGLAFANVLAERGSGPDLWILMAHYDAKAEASGDSVRANRTRPVPGANDGASGVAVWLEAARLLREPPEATFRILLTDGEDGFEDCHPLAGSLFHAQTLSDDDRARIRGVILLDMVGDPAAEFCYAHDAPALREMLVAAAVGLGVRSLADAPDCEVIDDQTPFAQLGLPAVDVIDFRGGRYPPYWHTLADVPSQLSADTLGEVGRVVLRALEEVTGP